MDLKPDLQKMKYHVVVGGLILLLIWLLSGCMPVSDDTQVFPGTERLAALTQTASPFTAATQMPTGTSSLPTKTTTSIAALTATSFPDGYILFENDFETGTEGLILAGNESSWVIQADENGNHFLCNASQSKPGLDISVGDERWTNYQLSFEVKDFEFTYDPDQAIYTREEVLAIRVRELGDAAYHFLVYFVGYKNLAEGLTPDASEVHFHRSLSKNEGIWILTEGLEATIENFWYPVRVSVNEGAIQFDWNNTLVLDYHDEEYLSEGAISFYTNYGTCLDNIRVTNIGKSE